jgi:hypothetical protein
MNEGNDADIDAAGAQAAWFITEADGFMGAQGRRGRLLSRVAQRMRRRVRPEHLISNSLFGLFRYGALAAIYLSLAYAAKVLLGISITFNRAMF